MMFLKLLYLGLKRRDPRYIREVTNLKLCHLALEFRYLRLILGSQLNRITLLYLFWQVKRLNKKYGVDKTTTGTNARPMKNREKR